MLMKNILAAFAIAGLVAAAPVEDIEARATCTKGKAWCCDTALSPVNIFFIRGIGKGCIAAGGPNYNTCPSGKKILCCTSRQIVVSFSRLLPRLLPSAEGKATNREQDDGDVVCTT